MFCLSLAICSFNVSFAMQDQETSTRFKSWLHYLSPELKRHCYENPNKIKCQRIKKDLLGLAHGKFFYLDADDCFTSNDSFCSDVKDALKETALPPFEQTMEMKINHRNRRTLQDTYDHFSNKIRRCSKFNIICGLWYGAQRERWIHALETFPKEMPEDTPIHFEEKDIVHPPKYTKHIIIEHTVNAFEDRKLAGKMVMDVRIESQPKACHINTFLLENAVQNSSIPHELLARQAAFAKQVGCTQLSDSLWENNFRKDALELYKEIGAEIESGRKTHKESVGPGVQWWNISCVLPDESSEAYFKCKKKAQQTQAQAVSKNSAGSRIFL